MSRRIRFEEISDPRDGGWRKAKEKNEAYIANLVVDSNEIIAMNVFCQLRFTGYLARRI